VKDPDLRQVNLGVDSVLAHPKKVSQPAWRTSAQASSSAADIAWSAYVEFPISVTLRVTDRASGLRLDLSRRVLRGVGQQDGPSRSEGLRCASRSSEL
jgi:hypothetical protein